MGLPSFALAKSSRCWSRPPPARTKHTQLEAAIKNLKQEHRLISEAISAIERLKALTARSNDSPRRIRSEPPAANEQRYSLRSASDLPRDSEAADRVGEQQSEALRSLEEAPEVPMTLRGASKVAVGSRV
jgi:hypothetical protein